jgi:hypothetical protein
MMIPLYDSENYIGQHQNSEHHIKELLMIIFWTPHDEHKAPSISPTLVSSQQN